MGTIEISAKEYNELNRAAERIAAVKRLAEANEYMCVKDILAILGIEREGEQNVSN